MSRTALITGVSGQDGAYLARLLLAKGYRVIGGRRPASMGVPWRLQELRIASDVELAALDLADPGGIAPALERLQPDEIYNLAAQSSVARSFDPPLDNTQTHSIGPLRLHSSKSASTSTRLSPTARRRCTGRRTTATSIWCSG